MKNKYKGTCHICNKTVEEMKGKLEKDNEEWKVRHHNCSNKVNSDDRIITQKLYNGEITISFNAGTEENPKHIYTLIENGKSRRPVGVTTYLGMINKPALIPWAVRVTVEYIREHLDKIQIAPSQLLEDAKEQSRLIKEEAAKIGSEVHEWVEMYIKGKRLPMPTKEEVLNGVNNFLAWVEKANVDFHKSEEIIYSKKYGYVGQADIIASIDGKKYLVDIKTCNGIWGEHLAQTAAYHKAYEEQTGEKLNGRIIMKIDKDADVPVEPIFLDKGQDNVDVDFECFLSTIKLYEWQKDANARLKELKH